MKRIVGISFAAGLFVIAAVAQEPLKLNKENAFFFDDAELGDEAGERWKADGQPGPVIRYGSDDGKANGNRSIYYLQADSSEYKRLASNPHFRPDAWSGKPEDYGYGAQVRFMVPEKKTATLPNEAFDQLGVFSLLAGGKGFASIYLAEENRNSVTDSEIEIRVWGRLPGSNETGKQYLTVRRGEWHTLQIDHLDGGPDGRPIFVDGELWVFLPPTAEFCDEVGLCNISGAAEGTKGEIFYDDILIARP